MTSRKTWNRDEERGKSIKETEEKLRREVYI